MAIAIAVAGERLLWRVRISNGWHGHRVTVGINSTNFAIVVLRVRISCGGHGYRVTVGISSVRGDIVDATMYGKAGNGIDRRRYCRYFRLGGGSENAARTIFHDEDNGEDEEEKHTKCDDGDPPRARAS